ncbi:MAG: acylneuraminate cytidylyltransferase [Kiritimatiellae bacterium]|nr:acylneuraminate cytidylyltransferase [Kiritimatiellia bacterium]MDD5522690.1 acylneuraminate cytidylyltransferase [Kiritimatiellia bacterium]
MKILAIIPARGGSKGIPGKNILAIAGQPLLSYSIQTALKARTVNRVVVSTDDLGITDVARKYGAEVVQRPSEISGDLATSEAALLHVLDILRERESYEPDLVVFLQATSPVRLPEDIDGTVTALREAGADSAFSACAEHFTGRWRRETDGSVNPVNFKLSKRPMRQEYPLEYLENGSIYVFRPTILRDTGCRLGGKIAVYSMPAWRSFQLDEVADIEWLEWLISRLPATIPDEKLQSVRLLVLDFDGVLTDNHVVVDQNGRETVKCHRGDSLGLDLLRKAGIPVVVLSTETNVVVAERCRKLKVECVQGVGDKLARLQAIALERRLPAEEIAYVGNDINDLGCLRWVGVPIGVADIEPAVRDVCRLITRRPGGHGAVRDVVDWLLAAREKESKMVM